jgi:hypothetical protein
MNEAGKVATLHEFKGSDGGPPTSGLLPMPDGRLIGRRSGRCFIFNRLPPRTGIPEIERG